MCIRIRQNELEQEIKLITQLHQRHAHRLLAAIDASLEIRDLARATSVLRAARELITQLEGKNVVAMLSKDLEG